MNWMLMREFQFLDNTPLAWALTILAFLATFTVVPLIKKYVETRRRKWYDSGKGFPAFLHLTTQLISRTSRLFLWTVAVYVGTRFLDMHPRAERAIQILVVVSAWLQVGIWAVAAVRFTLEKRPRRDNGDAVAAGSLTIIMFVTHLIVWAIVVLLALGNLGVNITALVAGLGIGGIAIALAVQTILGDLLASLSIALDKPFRIGDTLGIDDYAGTVEDIGIKSTRLRSVSGEQLIISNADILKSRVRNLGRMSEQRALLSLYLDYETAPEQLGQVAEVIKAIVGAQAHARFHYCVFKSFGVNGLEFEVAFYVEQPRGLKFLQTLDAVNRGIHQSLSQRGIRFAYPTRTAWQAPRLPQPANGES